MKDQIREVRDFPQTGVVFRDIFPLLKNCFGEVIDDLSRKVSEPQEIDYIVGIESRGFIFAAALAYKLNKGFLPIRKKGKLPGPVLSEKITLEYGETELEMPLGKGRVLIVDDVVATGGTLQGALKLAIRCGFTPIGVLSLVNIKHLNQFSDKLALKSLFEYTE